MTRKLNSVRLGVLNARKYIELTEAGHTEEAKDVALHAMKSGLIISETFVECVLRNHYTKESRNAAELHP